MTSTGRVRESRDDPAAAEQSDSSSRVARWTMRIGRSRRALWVLSAASFAETIIVPIPIELVLIPFMATNRHRLWLTATVVTAGCLLASLIGYGVGYLLFDTVGKDVIAAFGWSDSLDRFRNFFDQYGFWAIIAVGVIPIPFQIAMLVAGAANYSIALFVLAAVIARAIRYYGLALLVYAVGDRAEAYWRSNKATATVVAVVTLTVIVGVTSWYS